MKLKLLVLMVLALSPALAQTYSPFLPDANFYNYTGDQVFDDYWPAGTARYSHIVYNQANCAEQGLQGNPPSYAGYLFGGALGYHKPPPTLPMQCGPLNVHMEAIELSYNSLGSPDHLAQLLVVNPIGTLPGGTFARLSQYEACSLIGDDGLVGDSREVVFNPGLCVYYGGSSTM